MPAARSPTSVVLSAPSKKPSVEISSGTVAKASAKSAIQVEPIIATSGVLPPAMAVWILLCAASHGIGVTSIFTSGFAFSNSATRSGRASPSAPIAQTEIVPVAGPSSSVVTSSAPPAVSSVRPHPLNSIDAAATAATPPRILVPFTSSSLNRITKSMRLNRIEDSI